MVKYNILSINIRRSKLYAVIDCLFFIFLFFTCSMFFEKIGEDLSSYSALSCCRSPQLEKQN